MGNLRKDVSFWTSVHKARFAGPDILGPVAAGILMAIVAITTGSLGSSVHTRIDIVAGLVTPIAVLAGAVLVCGAVLMSVLGSNPTYCSALGKTRDGAVSFLGPYTLFTGIAAGCIGASVVYLMSAALLPEVWEIVVFVMVVEWAAFVLADSVAIARNIGMHAAALGKMNGAEN